MKLMSSNNDKKIGTISFSNLNFSGKRIDFSKIDTSTDTTTNNKSSFAQNDNNKPNVVSKSVNQLRKFDFSSLKKTQEIKQNKDEEGKVINGDKNNVNKENQQNNQSDTGKNSVFAKDQFRKPILSFQKKHDTSDNKENNDNKYEKQQNNDNNFKFKNKNFNGNKNISGSFNKGNHFGDRKFSNNNNNNKNQNNNNNVKKFDKNSNFFKKSSQIKVKINNDNKKDFTKQTFVKTSKTGSNVDKYSINSMLKTMSNNIELDTEIDDVLGNVISVKLSGINSANSLQKERKVRTSNNKDNKQQVKFNIPVVRTIKIYNNKISLANLADQMAVSVKELNKLLRSEGVEIDASGYKDIGEVEIDGDTAELIAESCGHKIVRLSDSDAENNFISATQKSRTNVKSRAPIVTIMGHVDHGKTTLLDYIRKSSVASGEAGGITQHIGAYRTKVKDKMITFLDTPGHAAFSEMRARGAKVTDVIIIVVAADDGIMPQTEEAISHAKNSGCPIIVAINKIDKPEANIERTKQMLLQYELVPEEFGGDVMVIPISAKEGKNIDKLLEAILLQAEMLDLKASYDGNPEGFVVEAKMDKKRGALATVIVKEGTLKQGDFIIVGEQYGKIKGMFDENGKMLKEAEPSVPVEILGLNAVPNAGDIFYAVKNEKEVKEIITNRQEKAKQVMQQQGDISISNDDILSQLNGGGKQLKTISFIIKTDTKGSLEAIINTVNKFENDEVKLKVAHSAVGPVNDSDVLLAATCNGYIMTFNTQKPDKQVVDEAEKRDIEIRDYKIIYELFDDIKAILSGKLKPVVKKIIQGHAEVKAIFEISKVGKIAGCLVKDGIICRGANVAVMRNGTSVFETKCNSLKHEKEVVKDVQSGQECGVGLDLIDDVKAGDILEFFTTKEEKKSF